MKKILFLLLLSVSMYGQVPADATPLENIQITNNTQDNVSTKVAVQTNEGVINWKYIADIDVKTKARLSTGLLKNGLISANGDPTKFNITAGIGIISNFDDPENPTSTIVNFPAFTGITPTYLLTGTITYVAINSTPAVVMQATPFTPEQRRSLIVLGAVIHSNLTTINVLNNISAPSNATTNQLHDFIEAVGALNITGNKYTANGANLQLNKSAGLIFKLGSNFANDWKNPHELAQTAGTSLTFRYRTQNGTEGSDRINLDPALYDLNNVLTSVPNNKFTIQTVTMFQSGLTRIQYGQNVYDDLATAKNAVFTRNFVLEPNSKENGIIRAYIIMKNTTTSLQNVADADILEAQKFGGVASGGVALTLENIVTALGYTPENVANKQNSLAVDGTGVKFPTVDAVNSGFVNVLTPQNVAGQKTFTNGISAQNVNYLDFINIDWAGLGDSTTLGVGSTSGTTSYFDIVSARMDFKSTTKLGASGATVMPTVGRTKLSDIIPTIPAGTDLITLMIGINDHNLSNPIGDVYATLKKSFVSLDETVSFAEAFRYNLETIKNNFPNAKIIVITPSKVDNTIAGDFDTKFYVDAEIAIANWLSIPVINAHENSGINSNTPIFLSDGLHPNDAGYQLIANKVQAGLITNPENISSNTFNDAVIADNVTVGGTSTTGTDGKILFKGFRGVTQGRIEMYPFGGLGVPSTVIFSSGTGIGSGFSYFNAESGRYGFGTTTDNGVDKLQVNGSVLVKKFTVDDSINGILRTILSNSSAGTDNMNSLTFRNDLGQISDITLFGSNWIPSGLGDDVANGVRLLSSGIGGISLRNTGVSASTRFYTGSSEVMRIGSNVLISTTTDNGVDKLQVNGSVLATSFNGSATLTGTPTAPTATAGTNTTQIATTAFVLANSRPYKVYTALLTQSSTSAPTATVLENGLSGAIVWTRTSTGVYVGTLTGDFTNNKTSVSITNGSAGAKIIGGYSDSVNTISIGTVNSATSTVEDDVLFKATIEIRVYN